MNLIKKVTCILIIFSLLFCVPLISNGSTTSNEKIIEEAQKYLQNSTPIILNTNSRIINKPYSTVVNRSANMSITRSSTNNGISLVITQNSGYNVDVCVFNEDASKVIGSTHHVPSDQLQTINWSANELGNNRKVLIFMSCYRDVKYNVWGSVVY